jgi:hypothetical protein
MRRLTLDWADLEISFRDGTTDSYLDSQTGEVLSVLDGFDDEVDVGARLQRAPSRYIRIHAVDKDFARQVVARFAERERRPAMKQKLQSALAEVGGLTRALSVLREDKAAYGAYSRFEQNELLGHIEAFLARHGVGAENQAPAPELFEGLSS